MSDVITYVILGFFGLFFLYFIYTLVDTLILSKRVKRKVHSIEDHEAKKQEELKKKEISNNVAQEEVNKESKENKIELKSSIKSKAKPEKRKFSLFKLKKKNKEKENKFVSTKVDDAYHAMIKEFVLKTNGSWVQKDFYELILKLVSKGYDKKPSEVQKDLQLTKQDISLNAQEKSNIIPHTTGIENLDSDKAILTDLVNKVNNKEEEESVTQEIKNIAKESKSEVKEIKKDVLKVQPEVKEEIDKIKESKDNTLNTRAELDKTLNEIKSLRSKLKNI